PRLTAWRAPIDNDGVRAWHFKPGDAPALSRWVKAGLHQPTRALDRLTARLIDGRVHLVVRTRLWGAERAQAIVEDQDLVVTGDGTLTCAHRFTVPAKLPDLPRLGVELIAPDAYEALTWFGRGPHESYCDRKAGALLGRYASTVTDQYVPYILPQEHGNLTDLRWMAIRAPNGAGLLASAIGTIEGKATRYRDDDLTKAWHTVDIAPDRQVHLHLDVRQRGVGGASCGPDTLEQHRVASGQSYRLAYRLIALAKGEDAGERHRE
ncbi:MAG: beta-galactosidase, partial [Planctomycetes bacterium]|nr:beta-galactosidase [Planctomycetota bacterium]